VDILCETKNETLIVGWKVFMFFKNSFFNQLSAFYPLLIHRVN